MTPSRDLSALIVSRLKVHGGILQQAMSGVCRATWVGRGLPIRMSPVNSPALLLAELVGLFRGYKSLRGPTRPVVVVQFLSLDAIAAFVFRRLTGCRVLLYAIGSDVLGERRPGQSRFLRWAVGKADCVICVNRAIEERVRRLGARDTVVLPSAFVGFEGAGEAAKNFDVVTVGALIPLKMHELLIDSCALIPRQTRLAIVGDGPLRGLLETRAAGHEGHEVTFLGLVPRERVFETLRHARLYVQCSTYEGVPTSVLEAVWAGLPVVAVESGYTKDLVELYKLDIILSQRSPPSLASSVEYVLDNYDEAASKASSNKEALVQYTESWSRTAEGILRTYSQDGVAVSS